MVNEEGANVYADLLRATYQRNSGGRGDWWVKQCKPNFTWAQEVSQLANSQQEAITRLIHHSDSHAVM